MSRSFNNSQKTFIWNRQKGLCGSCSQNLFDEVDIEYHHILNYKDGGASIVENAVMLCEGCHLHCHDYNFRKSVLIYRAEFKYANWEENSFYKGRKKGKEVEFTKKTLDDFDKHYEGKNMQEKDSIENHIRMLNKFKENLLTLKPKIIMLRDEYKKQIDIMENAGFFVDIITPLRNKHQAFSSKVVDIDNQLRKQDLIIERMVGILNRARARMREN